MKKTVKNESGFTLVELIVVMSILLVLAVIGITRFAGLTDQARLQADQTLASSISVAAQAWIAEGDHTYSNDTISIQSLKDDNYLLKDIDYKTQTTGIDFSIDYDPTSNKITVKAGDEQFYPVP